jgi:carbamate kinase
VRVVAALGGNALLRRGEHPDADVQLEHLGEALDGLAALAADCDLIVTHGNGPQVGLLAIESADDPLLARPYPLDALGAQTQGMIGYWLLQGLENRLPNRKIASLITQTLVSADDPAFANPTKFVGPVYTAQRAQEMAARAGWAVGCDGESWRRVVPSPTPSAIIEAELVADLVGRGAVVICAGGGGAPVIRDSTGLLIGVEAVVDKDATAALLAQDVGADLLLLLTDVSGIIADFGTPSARTLPSATVSELRAMAFPSGSMGPKVSACCDFVEATGRTAIIGSLGDIRGMLALAAGTIITAA